MIELLKAKEDIYWENPCDGEKPLCTKGNWYKVIKHTEYTVIFENDLGMPHNWNIDEVDEVFYTIDFEKGFEALNSNNSKLVLKNNKFDNVTQEFYGHTVPAISKELYKTYILDGEFTITRYSNDNRPYENWKMSISRDKFVRCITPLADDSIVVEGIYGYVDKVHNKFYYHVHDGMDKYIVADVYATDKGYEFVLENKDSAKVSSVEEASDIMDAVTATKEGILASFGVPKEYLSVHESAITTSTSPAEIRLSEGQLWDNLKWTTTKPHNPIKNISRNKFLRCVDMCKEKEVFTNLDGSNTYWMDKSPCGKYYYWEDYNRKNGVIYFRGEVDWVEKNYRKDNPEQRKELAELVESLRDYYDEKDPVIVAEENHEDYWKRIKSSGGFNASLEDKVEVVTDPAVYELADSLRKDMPIKSDGGKSDYYKIVLTDWIMKKQKENGYIMLEDLAEIIFDNDFNFTNVFKAQKRMFELKKGRGKAGNDFEYDAKKCHYYVDKQVEVEGRK